MGLPFQPPTDAAGVAALLFWIAAAGVELAEQDAEKIKATVVSDLAADDASVDLSRQDTADAQAKLAAAPQE